MLASIALRGHGRTARMRRTNTYLLKDVRLCRPTLPGDEVAHQARGSAESVVHKVNVDFDVYSHLNQITVQLDSAAEVTQPRSTIVNVAVTETVKPTEQPEHLDGERRTRNVVRGAVLSAT
jgi:hypothetical protein